MTGPKTGSRSAVTTVRNDCCRRFPSLVKVQAITELDCCKSVRPSQLSRFTVQRYGFPAANCAGRHMFLFACCCSFHLRILFSFRT